MNNESQVEQASKVLLRSVDPGQQMQAREALKGRKDYFQRIFELYMANPFLRLTDEERQVLQEKVRPVALGQFIAARHAAAQSDAPKYVIFCMPKSGSSFVQSALRQATDLPFVSLTGFSSPRVSSEFGMNSREQELDEGALIRAALASPQGMIAQHHTRYSQYLGFQMKLFGVTPLVTIRNILDCIVSFDDMMVESRTSGTGHWVFDPQFALPVGFQDMEPDERYTVLAHSYGVWLINFYLSWARARRQRLISPLIIRYEDHILNRPALVELLASRLDLSEEAQERLRGYVEEPDLERSRFNVGRQGRGSELVPEKLQVFLSDYLAMFSSELSEAEMRYLVR